jgi:hypothetical protein
VIDSLVLSPLTATPFIIVDLIWLATFNWKMAFITLIVIPVEFVLSTRQRLRRMVLQC